MSGVVVEVLRRTRLNFQGVATDVVQGPGLIDTLGWVSAVLQVIFYSRAAQTNPLLVDAQNVLVSPEDQTQVLYNPNFGPSAQVVIVPGDTPPLPYTQVIVPPIGRYLRVALQVGAANTDMQIGISIIGRSA